MAEAAAATAVLPLRVAGMVMKTLAVTAMVGAQTTINNQIKAVTETATEMAKWQQQQNKGNSGGGGGRAAAARGRWSAWRRWQQFGKSMVLAARQRGGGVGSGKMDRVLFLILRLYIRRPHTDRIPEGVPKMLR